MLTPIQFNLLEIACTFSCSVVCYLDVNVLLSLLAMLFVPLPYEIHRRANSCTSMNYFLYAVLIFSYFHNFVLTPFCVCIVAPGVLAVILSFFFNFYSSIFTLTLKNLLDISSLSGLSFLVSFLLLK